VHGLRRALMLFLLLLCFVLRLLGYAGAARIVQYAAEAGVSSMTPASASLSPEPRLR